MEVREKNLKKKKRWGKRREKDKVPPKELPCTLQEETSQEIGYAHELVKVHEVNQKRDKFSSEKQPCTMQEKTNQNVLFVEIHEQNLKREGKVKREGKDKNVEGKVPSEEHPSQEMRKAQLAEIAEQKNNKYKVQREITQEKKAQLVEITEHKREKFEYKAPRGLQTSQEISQNENAQLVEIIEQKREKEFEDKAPQDGRPSQEREKEVEDEVHPCTLQEKTNENMDARLLKICEQYLEEGGKGKKERTRNDMLLADPFTYGSSLLNDLTSTPGVEIRPPSRSGVGFSISSGNYRPESRRTWSRKLSPMADENGKV